MYTGPPVYLYVHRPIFVEGSLVYTCVVTKRLIDIDDEALEQARTLLKGATVKETVNIALQDFCHRDAMVGLLAHIQKLAAEDLGDPQVMEGVHRRWP